MNVFATEENMLITTAPSKHLLSTFYVPGTVLRCLDELTCLILTTLTSPDLHFGGEKTQEESS